MKTTKEIFSTLYGEIPERATCHIKLKEYASFEPCFQVETVGHGTTFTEVFRLANGRWFSTNYSVCGPDVSDIPAQTWKGFFDEKLGYDNYFCMSDAEIG